MKAIHDIQRETRAPGAPEPREALNGLVAEKNTVLCLVFGEGADAEQVSKNALGLANTSSDCEAVEVVRIRDAAVLQDGEKTWPSAETMTTVLTFERRVSSRLPAGSALSPRQLRLALLSAAAGEVTP
jgi:hypothetical protein